jgi:lysophospholipase L1-like esterase
MQTWRDRRVLLPALLMGLAFAGCSNKGSSPSPTQPSPVTKVVYTAIGASDAIGVGASVPCLPFVACPDGTGYVPVLTRRLAQSREVQPTNLGIPAAVLSPEIQQLGLQLGRTVPANFLQGEMPFVPRDSTLVTIFAGGNDTNTIGAAAEAGAGGADPAGYIDRQVRGFAQSFDTLLRGVRDRAPGARIVVANLPNLAGLPYASTMSLARRQGLQRISVGITRDAINGRASGDVVVVDLLCDPRSYDPGNYSSDGFHPNDSGYAYMADALFRAAQGAASPPASSCAEMALVPPM